MSRTILICSILALSGLHATAFDKIFCQSSMHDWIVTLTESSNTAILTPYLTSTTLSEIESETFYIKNAANEIVATAFPWNGIYVRKNKNLSSTYEVSHNENPGGFSIGIKDLKTKRDHILCPVRATPAQNWLEFKSTNYLKVLTPVPNAFFAAPVLSV